MYDRQWARSIVEKYQALCTRAQQIDACIQQIYCEQTCKTCTRMDIQTVLIDSLQGKSTKTIWREYKRLNKKMPLDKDLLYGLAGKVIWKIRGNESQAEFDF